jgi:hypothetical protein
MNIALTHFVQVAERALPMPTPTPDVFEPERPSELADAGVVRELTARVLRASAESSLRLAHRIAPERNAA